MVWPKAFAAGVKVSVPLGAMAGRVLNRAGVSVLTWKVRVWADSLAGPAERPVAQLVTVCGPAS